MQAFRIVSVAMRERRSFLGLILVGEGFIEGGVALSEEDLLQRLRERFGEDEAPSAPLAPLLQTAGKKEILLRMLRNLKIIFMQGQQWDRLLMLQQRLLILLPNDAVELRDRGVAFAHLDCPQAALDDIEKYLMQRPRAQDTDALREQANELRKACKRLN